MIKEAIQKLLEKEDLSVDESRGVMMQIMSGQSSHVHIVAFLTALRQKGETSDEILGAAEVMREKVRRVEHHQATLFDNCGTGGDGAGTFNISTTAAFVLAGCGLAIGKHGNRSVSSRCGSADLLQALGVNISLTPEQMGRCIDEIDIGFLFAPSLHPAMKEVAPVRKELGFRTIFNLLGPLTNPASATHQLIGVFSGSYAEKLAIAGRRLGIKRVCTVFNRANIDELATTGINETTLASDGTPVNLTLNPEEYGFSRCTVEDLSGGSADDNARITLSILKGERGPRRETVLLNAAVGLMVAENADSVTVGIEMAAESIDSGRALKKLQAFSEFTNGFKNA